MATGIALVVLLYLVALVAAAGRSDGRGGTASSSSTPDPEPPDGLTGDGDGVGTDEEGVRCRHCGTENEPGYRFCSGCAGELRGAHPADPLGGHGG